MQLQSYIRFAYTKCIHQVLRDGSVKNRAQLTVPWPLYLDDSKVKNAGQGVWTSAALPQGLVFGPCEGRIVRKAGKMSGYSWEVSGSLLCC